MGNNRKTKIILIIALVIAVIGMSLGFAAFSNILTISSSATVTPNSEDFKIKIYGFKGESVSDAYNLENFSSEDYSDAFSYDGGKTLYSNAAIINNNDLTIKNINATLSTQGEGIFYIFLIKNEGAYKAYFDLSQLVEITPLSCTAEEGTTTSLVESACSDIIMKTLIANIDLDMMQQYQNGEITLDEFNTLFNNSIQWPGSTGAIEIAAGDAVYFEFIVYYQGTNVADGPFTVTFEDIKLEFSSRNPNLSE